MKWIHTNQGGHLAGILSFRKCIKNVGYILEHTGAGAPFQNTIVERAYCVLVDMMFMLLSGSNLSSQYRNYVLQHAFYIKNRLPHQVLLNGITPCKRYTGRCSNISHLHICGSHVIIKQPRVRQYKLDNNHTTLGICLGFTSTTRTIRYEDHKTNGVKCTRHVIFD